jgi:hypothetical protein
VRACNRHPAGWSFRLWPELRRPSRPSGFTGAERA